MRTIKDERTLEELVERLRRVQPDSQRRWGTLTAAEMLCHLADAHESVLGTRVPPGPAATGKKRGIMKWVALYSGLPWPKGVPTRPGVDPKREGTRPADFEADRARVITTLEAIRAATPSSLSPVHIMFGPMSADDWYVWAHRHVHHHLTQFGV